MPAACHGRVAGLQRLVMRKLAGAYTECLASSMIVVPDARQIRDDPPAYR